MSNKIIKGYCPDQLLPLENTAEAIADDCNHYMSYHLGRFGSKKPFNMYEALSYSIRARLVANWQKTWVAYNQDGGKRAYYLSLEFLIGRALGNHILNLDVTEETEEVLSQCSKTLAEIEAQEADAGLGNGGLGRLAACFMDSCASLQLPVLGYGIRYKYGMFRQEIINGEQKEAVDMWLRNGTPWELERPDYMKTVKFCGRSESYVNDKGEQKFRWVDTQDVLAIPFDVPVSGYDNNTVNTLRLWEASATNQLDLTEFNAGSYTEAIEEKSSAEHISMVLYPNDSSENGKELRLRQQYFLVSASLQDVVKQWIFRSGNDFSQFAEKNVFQMNDTHPTLAVAELMRILMDVENLSWDDAWEITSKTMAYTNHTLLPEALEQWSVKLMGHLLPRLLDIIYEINSHFLQIVAMKWPGDSERQRRMSIIGEGADKTVRMAHLGIVGSFSVNGVAALHSELLKQDLFQDFYQLWPEKFNNKTNGVTPRRWIAHANPLMTQLISQQIGDQWIADLSQIEQLKSLVNRNNKKFHKQWKAIKHKNKQRLTDLVMQRCGIQFNPEAMFDVQVKRIHEYKRQLLNVLHIIHLYIRIKEGRTDDWAKRCVLIGGKAAPGYVMAKSIIKLINNVAKVIDDDPDVGDLLTLAFFPNYDVSSMEIIAPAADLSEQISTAGKEASGTGNMKFMMNGALTIGTYDGANIEILDAVGKENFFLFGLKAEEVSAMKSSYHPQQFIDQDADLAAVIQLLRAGHFNANEPGIFDGILNALLNPQDPWMTLADFTSYKEAQQNVAGVWADQVSWVEKSICNTASSGFFSTDRTMQEYNNDIWKLTPVSAS